VAVTTDSALHACIVRPPSESARVLFIFSHGFAVDGTEGYRLFVQIAEELAARGHPSILFDYRGAGYSDLKFEEMTFDTECADLSTVVDFAQARFVGYRLVLWGMSFGTAVAAAVAAERSDIDLLVLWCLSAELYRRYAERLGPELPARGYTYIDKGFRVGRAFLDSLRDRDTYAAIRTAAIPTLLVHGDADTVAPVTLSQTAHQQAPDTTTLHIIAGGNHGWKSQPHCYDEALDVTWRWLAAHTAVS